MRAFTVHRSLITCRSGLRAHGRGARVGRGLGVGEHLPVHGVGVGVGVGVAVGVGDAVGVGVGLGEGPDCAQYLPPVSKVVKLLVPPQTIISLPVHTDV